MRKSKPQHSNPPTVAKRVDPALASLFESSLGVVKPPSHKSRVLEKRDRDFAESDNDEEDAYEDKEPSEVEDEDQDMSADQISPQRDDAQSAVGAAATERSRKRKRRAAEEDLEDTYMKKLQETDQRSKPKRARKAVGSSQEGKEEKSVSENEDPKDSRKSEYPIKHETLVPATADLELDKSARTIFLGNVPSDAISSKADYKALKKFFSTPGKIASVRFRSVAFSEQIPRKAAFVNHKLHEKQKTVNMYIVYKDIASAREALKLNGSIVLDRHIRVDSVAHPGKQDNKRCVFVGNLDFETQEEKLWRHFGRCGKVDYVRVVRDAKTNVGKGFAYVQFEDAMSVDQALLLDGQKMEGDRKLRVTRAKSVKRNASSRKPNERRAAPKKGKVYVPKADPLKQSTIGRATKLLGRAGASQLKKQVEVFEGLRATTDTDSGIKKGGAGKKKGGKARVRATARSTAWKSKN